VEHAARCMPVYAAVTSGERECLFLYIQLMSTLQTVVEVQTHSLAYRHVYAHACTYTQPQCT
jgi:hypothetical protein